jgi:N-hydroxyarylamine O-acetyltransferase
MSRGWTTLTSAVTSRDSESPPARADADALRKLHAAHLDNVPFENLSIHLGEPIALDERSVLDKLVEQRRGGFCYELNGGFAMLLGALGYQVELLGARVMLSDRLGPPLDHLALRVRTPDPWLVDVGFGAHSRYPLRLDTSEPQDDPGGTFEICPAAHGDLDVRKDGRTQYLLEDRPRELDEFAAMCWYQQNSPASMFTRSPVCTLPVGEGRVTLSGRLLIRTEDGQRTETALADDDAVLAAYRDCFGVELARVPTSATSTAV